MSQPDAHKAIIPTLRSGTTLGHYGGLFCDRKREFVESKPFNHIVVDDFFEPDVANALAEEFPALDWPHWFRYHSPIEIKQTANHYDKFGPVTYRAIDRLQSIGMLTALSQLTDCDLFADHGLHGGGWHCHGPGGRLNPHLDYSIHPKLRLERRLNLIIYLSREWHEDWGGHFGIWSAGELVKEVVPKFNRAVIFDTSQQSWHGLSRVISCPPGHSRNSLALYYLCEPRPGADDRNRALFVPVAG